MGAATIKAKRAEMAKKIEEMKKFAEQGTKIQQALLALKKQEAELQKNMDEIGKKQENLLKVKAAVKADASKLQSAVPEFIQYRDTVLKSTDVFNMPVPDPSVLKKVIDKDQKEINDLVVAWIEKLTAAFPKDIRPGMLFKCYADETVYEVVKGPTQATNKLLKGDAALWFDLKGIDGSKVGQARTLNREELSPKKNWKFVKA